MLLWLCGHSLAIGNTCLEPHIQGERNHWHTGEPCSSLHIKVVSGEFRNTTFFAYMEPTRRRSDVGFCFAQDNNLAYRYIYEQNSTKGLGVNFSGESARRLSTDRPLAVAPNTESSILNLTYSTQITPLQTQPTIFGMDFEPDNHASTKVSTTNNTLFGLGLKQVLKGSKSDLEVREQSCSFKLRSQPSSQTTKARNVVIFGDSGVGKSSLINMLAGGKPAATSNGVLGCTFQSRQYTITINGEKVNIWDTAGLDEGTRGRVQPETAEKNLSKLLRELRTANGIHLLVYCIRGPSVRKSLARNYTIFYSAMCRKKVPIVAVVTGLENEPTSMEDWWTKGEKELAKYKMRFDAHACVTTIDMQKLMGSVFEKRSMESQQSVRKLIMDNCHRPATRPPSDTNALIKAALLDFRSIMKSGWENVQPVSTVAFYQADIPLFQPGVWGDLRRINSQINGRSFVFQHVGDLSSSYITPRISKGGADLLIFAGTMTNSNVERFRSFYDSCNGDLCPLLVVTNDRFVDAWTERLNALGIGALVASIPSSSTDGQTQADLPSLIDELCLVRGPAKYRKADFLRIFRRKREQAGDEIPTHHG